MANPQSADQPMAVQHFTAEYHRVVARLANHLRELADEIEQRQLRRNLHDLKTDHAAHAARTLHTLTSGLANLGLDRLVEAAADADRAARDPRADQ